ncbi:MAG TPA: ubiquinone/menaquinone biosynthesis methyltransferase [Dehalococcoidia bacterium]|nr:ubiquinone/menaquinone biosynthesis methyltransferase [Dehalococcoidia bacterium]
MAEAPNATRSLDHLGWTRDNQSMFARVSPRYDITNALISLGQDDAWRREAARLAAPRPCRLAIDLATGTGDLGLCLLERCQGVVGVDLTPQMLLEAQRKVEARDVSERFRLVVADALRLPFADDVFDCATNAFALRNFANPLAALAEMRRVVRPGGRVVSLELTQARPHILEAVHRLYRESVVPLIGAATSPGNLRAYWYLPTSVHRMPTADDLAERMRGLGFRRVWYKLLNFRSIAIHVAEV